jgi:hypothetical protein
MPRIGFSCNYSRQYQAEGARCFLELCHADGVEDEPRHPVPDAHVGNRGVEPLGGLAGTADPRSRANRKTLAAPYSKTRDSSASTSGVPSGSRVDSSTTRSGLEP